MKSGAKICRSRIIDKVGDIASLKILCKNNLLRYFWMNS